MKLRLDRKTIVKLVAPRVGAWIETLVVKRTLALLRRAPRGRVD